MTKKIILAVLALSMLLTLGLTAFADEAAESDLYALPKEPLVITMGDAGYYADTRTSDPVSGEVVFDAYVNTSAFEGMTNFGIFIYNEAADENSKVSIQSGDLRSLSTYRGYYNASVYNISPDNFEDIIVAIPYVVSKGEIITGEPYTIFVNEVGKWLGPKK